MSLTKRWLEQVSEDMGLDGEINQAVIDKASTRAQYIIDSREDELRDQYEYRRLNPKDL